MTVSAAYLIPNADPTAAKKYYTMAQRRRIARGLPPVAAPVAKKLPTEARIGTCPVCGGEFSTKGGLMVHHGYTRPGFGYDVGDCAGVRKVAFEISPEGAIEYLAKRLAPKADEARAYTFRVPSITYISRLERNIWNKPVQVTYSATVTTEDRWVTVHGQMVREASRSAEYLARAVAAFEAKIAAWKPAPLRFTKR